MVLFSVVTGENIFVQTKKDMVLILQKVRFILNTLFSSGSVMCRNWPTLLAPSMVAAS